MMMTMMMQNDLTGTCPAWSLAMLAVPRYLTRRGLVTTVSWKIRGLSAKRARSICGVHLLAGTVKEDYGAGPKMGLVTCRHVLPGVGSMGSPEWSVPCVRTGCSP
jgi:hypothetical protein